MTKRVSLTETNNWDGQQADFEERAEPRTEWDYVVEISDEMFERWTRVRAEWREMEDEINRLYKEESDRHRLSLAQQPAPEPSDYPTAPRGISFVVTPEQVLEDSTDALFGTLILGAPEVADAIKPGQRVPFIDTQKKPIGYTDNFRVENGKTVCDVHLSEDLPGW